MPPPSSLLSCRLEVCAAYFTAAASLISSFRRQPNPLASIYSSFLTRGRNLGLFCGVRVEHDSLVRQTGPWRAFAILTLATTPKKSTTSTDII